MLAKQRDQLEIDALGQAFDVDPMHQELPAVLANPLQRLRIHPQIREGLPAVAHHPVVPVAPPARQIGHQPTAADVLRKRLEPLELEGGAFEQPRRHDHVRCAGIEPVPGGGIGDPSTDLHPAGPRCQRGVSGGLVARSEHDHVATAQVVGTVLGRVGSSVALTDEVDLLGFPLCWVVAQRAADDLHHPAPAEIDARPEHGPTVPTSAKTRRIL